MGLVFWIALYLTSKFLQMPQDVGAVVLCLALSGYNWPGQMNGREEI